ncbi:MAG: hypothetical protein JWN18_620 [Parcubacteria group bacterium]|nr:hypothetical protein [Parcubacteria group bacterium]
MLKRFDAKILSLAQKFCDKVQNLTGLNKFRLEKWACILWGLFFTVGIFTEEGLYTSAIWSSIVLLSSAALVSLIERAEKMFLTRGQIQKSLWHEQTPRICALLFVIFLVTNYFTAPSEVFSPITLPRYVTLLLWAYFSACIPRPPRQSQIRQWYQRVLILLSGRHTPAPAVG